MKISDILDWIKKHVWQTILIGFGLFFLPLFIVHIAYRIPAISPWFASTWEAGELITYIAGFEAFVGTVILGVVAARQNDKANDLNELMLKNDERRAAFERQPCIRIQYCNFKQNDKRDMFHRFEKPYFPHKAQIEQDVPENPIYHMIIQLINVSKSHATILLQSFNIIDLNEPDHNLTYDEVSFSQAKSDFNLASNQTVSLCFSIDKNRLFSRCPKLCHLNLRLFNSIGEVCNEQLTFLIELRNGEPFFEFIASHTQELCNENDQA